MKRFYFFLGVLVLIFIFTACQKKENAVPTANGTFDSSAKADSVKQLSAYPFTSKYVGCQFSTLKFSGFCGAEEDPQGNDSDCPYVFYIGYFSKNSMSIWDDTAIQIGNANGTVTVDIQGVINIDDNTIPNGAIRLTQDSLYVNYSSYVNYEGDIGYFNCSFRGRLASNRR